ncbi:unnamed protein product, partial [marine sediment metagenome]
NPGCQQPANEPELIAQIVIKEIGYTAPVLTLNYFESVEALQLWLGTQEILSSSDWNCVDYALNLQGQAAEDGYIINVVCHEGYFYNWFFTRMELGEGTHLFNSVKIGDWIYYIEPMNHEISRRAVYLGD